MDSQWWLPVCELQAFSLLAAPELTSFYTLSPLTSATGIPAIIATNLLAAERLLRDYQPGSNVNNERLCRARGEEAENSR
jgi:hypothetical protein